MKVLFISFFIMIVIQDCNLYGQSRKEFKQLTTVFKDSSSICDGRRYESFKMIYMNYNLDGISKRKTMRFFGRANIQNYMITPCLNSLDANENLVYFMYCSCNPKTKNPIGETCDLLFFLFQDNKLICISGIDY